MSPLGDDRRPVADLWRLPKVLTVQYQYVQYPEPHLDRVAGEVVSRSDAVEIMVTTDGPLPVRALGATLVIDGIEVGKVETRSLMLYRFTAYNYRDLVANAKILLGWVAYPQMSVDTGFVYTPPPTTVTV